MKDPGVPDEWSLPCSLILGLGLDDGRRPETLISRASSFFQATALSQDSEDNLDQCQALVKREGKRLNFALHLMLDLGETVEIQSVALQGDASYTASKVIPLFRIATTGQFKYRYLLITNPTNFLRKVKRKGDSDTNRRQQLCYRCLAPFTSKGILALHEKSCKVYSLDLYQGPPNFEPEIVMPCSQGGKPPHIEFSNIEALEKGAVVIYGDFETAIVPNEDPCLLCLNEGKLRGGRCRCHNGEHGPSFTKTTHHHKALAYSFAALDHRGQVVLKRQELTKEGEAGKAFIDALLEVEPVLQSMMNPKVPIIECESQIENFPFQTECVICQEAFTHFDVFTGNQADLPEHYERLVRHHDHKTGNLIGLAHHSCNLKVRSQTRIPVIFHNALGFDLLCFLSHLGNHKGVYHMECLPKNGQRLRSFRFNSYFIIDSLSHLSSSLGELTQTLAKAGHKYPILKQSPLCLDERGQFSQERMDRLLKKMHFPYEKIVSTSALYDMKQIPERKAFHSSLINDVTLTEEEYEETCEAFEFFKCKSLADFLLIYLEVDLYLLMELGFSYQETIYNWQGLYVWSYISMPGLAFDSFLRHSGAQLQLLENQGDYELFEANCRGGLSYTAKRLAEEKDGPILYCDFNSMYCSIMSEPMALDSFRWLTPQEIAAFDLQSVDPLPENGTAYILLVDLSYPPELCLLHSDVPLCPERVDITEEDLSPYTRELMKLQDGKDKVKARRLICTFGSRKNYLVHAQNLKLYLSLGIKLEAIHRIFSYRSVSFAKSFMQDCAEERARASSDFHKRFYKLVANSCYGRLLMAVRDFKEMKVANQAKMVAKWAGSPRMTSVTQVGDLSLIMMQPKKTYLNSLVVNGYLVLERAKFHLFSSYYYGFAKMWPGLETILSDTDSFVFQLPKGTNIRQDLKHPILRDMMDYSNLDPKDPLFDDTRKGLLRWKIEKGLKKRVKSACCLRPKCYALIWSDEDGREQTETKCKGVSRPIASSSLRFENYKAALLEGKKTYAEYSSIRCIDFQLSSVRIRKCALAASCISRYFFPCGIHSCPLRSFEIIVFEGQCRKCLGLTLQEQEEKLKSLC